MPSAFFGRRGLRTRPSSYFGVAALVCVTVFVGALVGSLWPVHARQAPTVETGVYTAEQAAAGEALYKEQCAVCHGDMLEGLVGPPLTGDVFLRFWTDRSLFELVDKIHKTMPYLEPGTLTREQSVESVAYMLKFGGYPAGSTPLPVEDAPLTAIAMPAPAAAPSTAAAGGTSIVSFPPVGNVAQMMRAIAFPSSNIIFNVQVQDPAEQPRGWNPGDSAFSWTNWGAGIYSGWELVDYASIALAESAPLLLTPGRRCENGRPAPIENEDWIKFTHNLIEVGREGYRISQTRNQEAVSEFTFKLADACLACHEVYRDKPGGTPEDPSNKAARCIQ